MKKQKNFSLQFAAINQELWKPLQEQPKRKTKN